MRKLVAVPVLALIAVSCSDGDGLGQEPFEPLEWPIEHTEAEVPAPNPTMQLNLADDGWVSVAGGWIVAGAATDPSGRFCVVHARPDIGVTGYGCTDSTGGTVGTFPVWTGVGRDGTEFGILGNLPVGAATVTIDGITEPIVGDVIVIPLGTNLDAVTFTTAAGGSVAWD